MLKHAIIIKATGTFLNYFLNKTNTGPHHPATHDHLLLVYFIMEDKSKANMNA